MFAYTRMVSTKPLPRRFAPEDVLTALESIFRAMLVSGLIVEEAEAAHFAAFTHQFPAFSEAEEPYLETEKCNQQYQFLLRMEALFTRTESYLLQDAKRFYPGNSPEWHGFDRSMRWKAVTDDEDLTPLNYSARNQIIQTLGSVMTMCVG